MEIHELVRSGNIAQVRTLLTQNPGLCNALDDHRRTPLHIAAKHDQLEMARLLLDLRARVNIRDMDGWTPLHVAAYERNVAAAKLLLEHKAKVNAKADWGQTPLHLAGGDARYYEMRTLLKAHGGRVGDQEYQVYGPFGWIVMPLSRLRWFFVQRGLAFWLTRSAWACMRCGKLYSAASAKHETDSHGVCRCRCGAILRPGWSRKSRGVYYFWDENESPKNRSRPGLDGWRWI